MKNKFKIIAINLVMLALVTVGSVVTLVKPVSAAINCKTITLAEAQTDAGKKDCPCASASLTGDLTIASGIDCSKGDDQADCLFGTYVDTSVTPNVTKNCMFTTITNTALFLVGAISVIMLIYGGIRYTVSGGDSTAVGNAKNTILYAIVGIIVSILAFAIVQFVVKQLV